MYPPAIFDKLTLKITVLLRVHFCTGVHPEVVTQMHTPPYFGENMIFFRIRICHETDKKVRMNAHPDIFQHFDPKNPCFTPCSFFVRVYNAYPLRVYT